MSDQTQTTEQTATEHPDLRPGQIFYHSGSDSYQLVKRNDKGALTTICIGGGGRRAKDVGTYEGWSEYEVEPEEIASSTIFEIVDELRGMKPADIVGGEVAQSERLIATLERLTGLAEKVEGFGADIGETAATRPAKETADAMRTAIWQHLGPRLVKQWAEDLAKLVAETQR